MMKCFFVALGGLLAFAADAAVGPWDADVSDFPRRSGETGDSARILRAVEAAGKGGVVWFPRGEYAVDEMLVVVDHTVGIRDCRWSNRFTRCHVWGGPVRNPKTGLPEYLPDSIAFDLHGYDAVLDDCYADTAMIGFNVCAMARLVNCGYHNNWRFRMDNPVVIWHRKHRLLVSGGRFDKASPHATPYRREAGAEELVWRDNVLECFAPGDAKELEAELRKEGQANSSSCTSGQLAMEYVVGGNFMFHGQHVLVS